MSSRTSDVITLLKGSNVVIDDGNTIRKMTTSTKDYNAECGSGFYLIQDKNIAEYYAFKIANDFGGTPTVNVYYLNIKKIKDNLKIAYFNALNKESVEYVRLNLEGKLPEDCPKKNSSQLPKDLCHQCSERKCKWNANYIEAILAEAEDYYNLTDILYEVIDNKMSNEEALLRINNTLQSAGLDEDDIHIQILLRQEALKYLNFSHSYTPKKKHLIASVCNKRIYFPDENDYSDPYIFVREKKNSKKVFLNNINTDMFDTEFTNWLLKNKDQLIEKISTKNFIRIHE